MSDALKMVPVKDIDFGKRWREDYGDMESFVAMVAEKGIFQPITVRQNEDKKYTLLAGGRRLTAAIVLKMDKIPALVRTQTGDDAEVDLREIELIENVHRKDFTWVEQTNLIAEIDRLCKSKDTNWSARKTAQLLGHSHPMTVSRALQVAEAIETMPELAQCKTQDEALKFVKKVEEGLITQELRRRQEVRQAEGLCDVLTLAKTNYKIGDALASMKTLPAGAGCLNLIEVDPPYGIDLPDLKRGDKADSYKEVPRDAYAEFLQTVAAETFRIAGQHCWMIFWYGPTHHQLVLTTLRNAGWEVDEIPAIWNKTNGQTMQPEVYLGRAYEPFFVCRKGRPALMKHGRSNVFDFAPVAGARKYHPTERPVALIEELIETFVGINSRIMIPFLGSGATLRAAYNLGCTGFGWDLNPEYKDKFLLAVEEDTKKLDAIEGDE